MLPWSVMPEGRLAVGHRGAHDVGDPGGAVEHRVLGVDVEVGEAVSHPAPSLASVSANHTGVVRETVPQR